MKMNCWEAKNCGREPGGSRNSDLGICPSSTYTNLHNSNNGINAGRSCWVVAGTFSEGEVKCVFANLIESCMNCDFYKLVKKEEQATVSFELPRQLLEKCSSYI